MILVTGFPRSGTGYMAKLLQEAGLDVQHERLGKDGISAWQWGICADDFPRWPFDDGTWTIGKARTASTSVEIVHVIRDPLKVISSVFHTAWEPVVQAFFKNHCLFCIEWTSLDNLALIYVAWNRMIAAQGPVLTVRVEDAPATLGRWLGKPVPDVVSRKTNSRPHGNIAVSQFRPEARELLVRFAAEHGYDLAGTAETVAEPQSSRTG